MALKENQPSGQAERQCPLCNQSFTVLLERITPEDFSSDGLHYISEHGTCSCGFTHKKQIPVKDE